MVTISTAVLPYSSLIVLGSKSPCKREKRQATWTLVCPRRPRPLQEECCSQKISIHLQAVGVLTTTISRNVVVVEVTCHVAEIRPHHLWKPMKKLWSRYRRCPRLPLIRYEALVLLIKIMTMRRNKQISKELLGTLQPPVTKRNKECFLKCPLSMRSTRAPSQTPASWLLSQRRRRGVTTSW